MSARRCLFGRPTPEQRARTREWLDNACKRMREEESKKWGFDFELGMPLPSLMISTEVDYKYEILPECSVPEFYRTKVISVNTSHSTHTDLNLSSTTLTPLSSPSTSEKEEPSLMDHNSSFEDEEEPKKWLFREPPTPRKSPQKRQQKVTDFYTITRKKNSMSPKMSPKNVIYTPKSRRPTVSTRSPY